MGYFNTHPPGPVENTLFADPVCTYFIGILNNKPSIALIFKMAVLVAQTIKIIKSFLPEIFR